MSLFTDSGVSSSTCTCAQEAGFPHDIGRAVPPSTRIARFGPIFLAALVQVDVNAGDGISLTWKGAPKCRVGGDGSSRGPLSSIVIVP